MQQQPNEIKQKPTQRTQQDINQTGADIDLKLQKTKTEIAFQEYQEAEYKNKKKTASQSRVDCYDDLESFKTVLGKFIRERQLFTVIGNKKHIHAEGWNMLALKFGLFTSSSANIVPQTKVEDGIIVKVHDQKFLAIGNATIKIAGRECTAYAYASANEKKFARKEIKDILATAQTRAESKVFRNNFSALLKSIGFEAVSHEEMIDVEEQKSVKSQKEAENFFKKEQK